ncbi:hypothetical protein [Streptomyces sp. VNUA24]|uniref:hypothetical protein n=1 Tax=Streptomyces sp. VNUA24 TaxID=3031131 RepID=UPI0023B7865E|nr:hypothetical protein [Streptomyces sp. VNUA24]WEH12207.1 hypothetical protein PYR72_00195 [Streptomyces sp. VNUA24]
MAETPSRTTALKEQYGTQVATDLEHNAKEQDRLRGEIDALNDQLLSLQQDHTVLVNMQQALGILTPEPTPAAEEAAATPSLPRQKATTPATGKRTRTKRATAPQSGKQTKAKPPAKATAPKATQPTLVELIRQHLTEQSEPRSAAEIATALTQTHPDRRIQTNVVRTTLEGLVAKSKAQRTRQGSSVYYTAAAEAQEPTTPAQADSEPVPASS